MAILNDAKRISIGGEDVKKITAGGVDIWKRTMDLTVVNDTRSTNNVRLSITVNGTTYTNNSASIPSSLTVKYGDSIAISLSDSTGSRAYVTVDGSTVAGPGGSVSYTYTMVKDSTIDLMIKSRYSIDYYGAIEITTS